MEFPNYHNKIPREVEIMSINLVNSRKINAKLAMDEAC